MGLLDKVKEGFEFQAEAAKSAVGKGEAQKERGPAPVGTPRRELSRAEKLAPKAAKAAVAVAGGAAGGLVGGALAGTAGSVVGKAVGSGAAKGVVEPGREEPGKPGAAPATPSAAQPPTAQASMSPSQMLGGLSPTIRRGILEMQQSVAMEALADEEIREFGKPGRYNAMVGLSRRLLNPERGR